MDRKKDSDTLIRDKINDNAVMMFSKSWCPYCNRAKKILNDLGIKFMVWEIDDQPDGGDKVKRQLLPYSGSGTVPQIFIGKQYFGGCSELDAGKDKAKRLYNDALQMKK